MSVSALFGSRIAVAPTMAPSLRAIRVAPVRLPAGGSSGLVIECSSRPQKKGTKHHMKTRPRKSQPWDIKRKPTVYAPLPPLPPEWTLVSADTAADTAGDTATTAAGGSAPPQS